MKNLFLIIIIIINLFNKQNDYHEFLIDNNEDIIGTISLNNKIDYLLLQGLDNEYYLNHDFMNENNNEGSIFLGYDTDLNRNGINEIFIPFNNYLVNTNDIIQIKYLDNYYKYVIVNKSNNKDKLIINYYHNNDIIKTIDAIRI